MHIHIDPNVSKRANIQKERYVISRMYKVSKTRARTANPPPLNLEKSPQRLASTLVDLAENKETQRHSPLKPYFETFTNLPGFTLKSPTATASVENILSTPKDAQAKRLQLGNIYMTPRNQNIPWKTMTKWGSSKTSIESPQKLSPNNKGLSTLTLFSNLSPRRKFTSIDAQFGPGSPYNEEKNAYGNCIIDNNFRYDLRFELPKYKKKVQKADVLEDINSIKQKFKISKRKIFAARPLTSSVDLKCVDEINMIPKDKILSPEEDLKLQILRKKINISNIFTSKISTDEEKKGIFKQLLLEYHPDKKKYDKRFADEIFDFLMSNKTNFLGAS